MRLRSDKRHSAAFALALLAGTVAIAVPPALAFCGFYVAQADSKLFNKASKVVLAWDNGEASVTMASDYEGDPKEFAVVIPVPTFIERKRIGIVDPKTVDHLDRFTAPRLVEYHDADPCRPIAQAAPAALAAFRMSAAPGNAAARPKVVVEASYEVGEYDIQILSAEESGALSDFLQSEGYRIPAGADDVLASYIKQKMRFFVAKVNLDRMELQGGQYIRPLQVRYASKKFMLPIRLGTVNANGPQDLIVYALTRRGRVETTNYRTVKMPTGMDVPLYVKSDFGPFYKAMFERQVERNYGSAVFVEYAWNMGWCDPCADTPLAIKELHELGARWLDPEFARRGAIDAYVTRLHVVYDRDHFPEDLQLQETRDTSNFQARYVLRHPWSGEATCEAGKQYRQSLKGRFGKEAETLADLTGWSLDAVRQRMEFAGQALRPTRNETDWPTR